MQFATLFEAFGVDSLENEVKMKRPESEAKRTKFEEQIFGEDVDDADEKDVEPPIMVIPEDRKITKREVQEFISNAYRKKGITAVWNMMDRRIQTKLLGMCNKSASSIKGFFEDIFTSPEKMLAILAVLFVIIILLDLSKPKAVEIPRAAMPEQFYYPQQMPQMYYAPPGFSANPINTS